MFNCGHKQYYTVHNNYLLCLLQGATNIESIVKERKQAEPFILITGDLNNPDQGFLVVDCVIVGSVEMNKSPLSYCQHILSLTCYIKGCNMFSFFEVLLASVDKLTSTIKHF